MKSLKGETGAAFYPVGKNIELGSIGGGRSNLTHELQHAIQNIEKHARVGNIYVNRNMIGAVVGVQPFGGEGLSGTGPKAGGPNYLQRLTTERTVSTNTSAIGGNATLLNLKS